MQKPFQCNPYPYGFQHHLYLVMNLQQITVCFTDCVFTFICAVKCVEEESLSKHHPTHKATPLLKISNLSCTVMFGRSYMLGKDVLICQHFDSISHNFVFLLLAVLAVWQKWLCQSTTLVQIEISQQSLAGLPWRVYSHSWCPEDESDLEVDTFGFEWNVLIATEWTGYTHSDNSADPLTLQLAASLSGPNFNWFSILICDQKLMLTLAFISKLAVVKNKKAFFIIF